MEPKPFLFTLMFGAVALCGCKHETAYESFEWPADWISGSEEGAIGGRFNVLYLKYYDKANDRWVVASDGVTDLSKVLSYARARLGIRWLSRAHAAACKPRET